MFIKYVCRKKWRLNYMKTKNGRRLSHVIYSHTNQRTAIESKWTTTHCLAHIAWFFPFEHNVRTTAAAAAAAAVAKASGNSISNSSRLRFEPQSELSVATWPPDDTSICAKNQMEINFIFSRAIYEFKRKSIYPLHRNEFSSRIIPFEMSGFK